MSAQATAPAVPPDHVTIEIDGRSMVVPKGINIIQAADKAGIPIPRFCYHEKLPIAANCRVCMVDVEMGGKPAPKPAPACATPVADGMKVFTQSKMSLSAQRNGLEFLLINHPLDCPICDQGGECELQDLAMGFGRSVSRFAERKRTVADENLGPMVQSEMTRCIHCTRCVRVMSEIAGTYELGGMVRGDQLQIGTYVGKPLMSELSGNVIDVCPVGALTDKPFRFRARPWELIARESIGYHDALGSNLWLHTRRGDVLRAVPRDNEAINECWLSDRDRYSREALRSADRLAAPRVKRDGVWVEIDWNDAIRLASEALRATPRGQLGALLAPWTSNEEGYLLAKLVRALGSEHIDHRLRQLDCSGAAETPLFGMPVAEVETAEVIVLIGCNPRHEMPLLGARMRKAAKRGATIYALNPLDFDFDFEFPLAGKRIVAPQSFAEAMRDLLDAVRAPDGAADFNRELVAALQNAAQAVVVFGEAAQTHPRAGVLRAAARALAKATKSACNEIPLGANAVGLSRIGALPGKDGLDAQAMLVDPRATYVLYGCEPPFDFADGRLALDALGKAGVVLAFGSYTSPALEQVATLMLPIALLPETEATLINVDGFAQTLAAGSKPPGEARPGWRVLRALGAALALEGFDFTEFDELRTTLQDAGKVSRGEQPAPRTLARLENGFAADLPQALRVPAVEAAPAPAAAAGALRRIATTPIYACDAVVRRAPPLQAHPLARAAALGLHPDDAAALGLDEGARALVNGVELPVEITARVPRGGAWIEAALAATATLPPYGAELDIVKA